MWILTETEYELTLFRLLEAPGCMIRASSIERDASEYEVVVTSDKDWFVAIRGTRDECFNIIRQIATLLSEKATVFTISQGSVKSSRPYGDRKPSREPLMNWLIEKYGMSEGVAKVEAEAIVQSIIKGPEREQ